METYDIVMVAVLAGATFFGFLKGFAWQVASVASLVLSYICAYRFADTVEPMLNADPRYSKYLAMLVVYCGTSFFVWIGFRLVSGTIDRIRLRDLDRQMGGLIGGAKGVLLCTVITFFAVSLTEQTRAAVLSSKSGVYIATFLHKATPIIPPEWTAKIKPFLDQLDNGLNPNGKVEYAKIPDPSSLLQSPMGQAAVGAIAQQYLPAGQGTYGAPTNGQPSGYPSVANPYGQAPGYAAPNYNTSGYPPVPNYGPQYQPSPYGQQPQYAPQPQYGQPPYANPYAQPNGQPYYGPTQPMNPYSSGS